MKVSQRSVKLRRKFSTEEDNLLIERNIRVEKEVGKGKSLEKQTPKLIFDPGTRYRCSYLATFNSRRVSKQKRNPFFLSFSFFPLKFDQSLRFSTFSKDFQDLKVAAHNLPSRDSRDLLSRSDRKEVRERGRDKRMKRTFE